MMRLQSLVVTAQNLSSDHGSTFVFAGLALVGVMFFSSFSLVGVVLFPNYAH